MRRVSRLDLGLVSHEEPSVQRVDADRVEYQAQNRIRTEKSIAFAVACLGVVDDEVALPFDTEVVVTEEGLEDERRDRLRRTGGRTRARRSQIENRNEGSNLKGSP